MAILLVFVLFLFSTLYSPKVYAITKNFWSDDLEKNIVYNPFQGLGICHWSSPSILNDPAVSWSYDATGAVFWKTVEPQEGIFNWEPIDNLIELHRRKGKKIWLQVLNADVDTVPQWAKEKTINGEKMIFMGTPNDPNNPCGSMNEKLPLPWNNVYLTLWEKVVHEMALRYDNNPIVETIVMMSGGSYGEMDVCTTCGPSACWAKFAGCCSSESQCALCENDPSCSNCVDRKFIEAVKNLIDMYMKEFKNKPVILQLASGVFHHTAAVIKPVLDYAIPKYGTRILLKSNGWHCSDKICGITSGGCDWGHTGVARNYLNGLGADLTKYGLEPGAWYSEYQFAQKMMECLPFTSYACLQSFYWEEERAGSFAPLREKLAQSLGSKVALKEVSYPSEATASASYNFSLKLKNLGEIPPFRPKRIITPEGNEKDIAESYQLTFQFIKDEKIFGHAEIDLNPPSHKWTKNQEINIDSSVAIPKDLPTGSYELRIALFDPEADQKAREPFFRFLNKDILDGQGRAKVGDINILGIEGVENPPSPPVLTPSISPLPTSTSFPSPPLVAKLRINLKAKFIGAPLRKKILASIFSPKPEFVNFVIMENNEIYQSISLDEFYYGENHNLFLKSYPFLSVKKTFRLEAPSEEPFLIDFGELKPGDLNFDNEINSLDWSLMKMNFGENGVK